MASRMERYYKNELINSGRSSRNKSLYDQIENLGSYTNIEGVASIDKIDEIDINKVQKMLQNRENYKNQKKLKGLLEKDKKVEEEKTEIIEDQKNYDIRDILSKIKKDDNNNYNKYRSLGEEQFNTLKSLSKKDKKYDIEKEEEELKEIISTIVGNKELNKLSNSDDVGLLDELKSDTMVGDASSIKKIIEEEKELKDQDDTVEMDKSFYTSSFGFTQSDFEELRDINHKIKKGNKFIIVMLTIILLIVVAGVLFVILK